MILLRPTIGLLALGASLFIPQAYAESTPVGTTSEPQQNPQIIAEPAPIQQEIRAKRDPFKRPMPQSAAADKTPRTELEMYPVEQFKVIAVLTGLPKIRAMVVAPNDKTYFIQEKTKIGIRRGVVKRIGRDGIVVSEKQAREGKEEAVDVTMRIQ